MGIFNVWYMYVIAYIFCSITRLQLWKLATKTSKNDANLTIILQLIAGATMLVWVPFFEFRFPTDLRVYLLLGLAIVFYTISNRIETTVLRGLEASTFKVLRQLNTLFMMLIGLIFFGESFIVTTIIGGLLIIFSNFLIFYRKGNIKANKYLGLGILSSLTIAIALTLDIGNAEHFNLPLYMVVTFSTPAILIFLFERSKISDVQAEFKNGNKLAIILTGIFWSLAAMTLLRAYMLGDVTVVAPLASLTVILNVFAGYIFLKERDNLLKKVIAGVLILVSVILIQM